ncbi:glycoside hydrolase family 99-like domain-containing protein [Luteimonas sp. e5]
MPSLRSRLSDRLFRILRAGFRRLPIGESTRDRWREAFFERFPRIRPSRRQALATAATPRVAPTYGGPAIGTVTHHRITLPNPLPARVVAFYLPQFHPIPENDAAWGEGYTEWRAVKAATPDFDTHVQPRLPGALGAYDLREIEVMRRQASLARDYGISAFCFYFYWFHGRTLLEQPLLQWLDAGDIDLAFCLCWANEAWTRTWDGRAGDVLIPQSHDAADDLAFIAHVARYLRDPRCLRVDGKPVLLVYRPGKLPDARATAARWRAWCRDNGIGEIHLAYTQSFERPDPHEIGFDAAVEFPPNLARPADITQDQVFTDAGFSGEVLDWRDLPRHFLTKPPPAYPLHPAVNCGWDNAPRRPGRGRSLLHAAPRRYRDWLRATIEQRLPVLRERGADDLVFVNAWNEWGEGAVLEPDARLDHAWLDATRAALLPPPATPATHDACAILHAWHVELLPELLRSVLDTGLHWRIVITTGEDRVAAVHEVAEQFRTHANAADIEIIAGENRGRDILPFLRVANRLFDEGEDVVLKLHTKQSPHRRDGDQWRREFLETMVHPAQARSIADAFAADARLGMVVPAQQLPPMQFYWGANAERVHWLLRRLGMAPLDMEHGRFAAGSMFWCRLSALRPLLDAHLEEAEFEPESGQVDGTLAHAIERIIAACVTQGGFELRSWPPDAALPSRHRYAQID